jgi:drug/metabolite transporter (DMT)-like permease
VLPVIGWAALFSVTTAISIVMLGNRDLIGGQINLVRLLHILIDWRFIVGAIFAFGSRMLFIMTNNALLKVPHLSGSATTITTLINSVSILLVIVVNYFVLKEKLSIQQGLGAFLILFGIYLVSTKA